ncbi:hypothetical protein BC629DRAFT_1560403 [Irpex lacteus]|nr:hypothetical protein BC629DRAFT_1560403 [Irpex lacteus]
MGSSATSELARFYLELVPLLNPFDRYRSLLVVLSLLLMILFYSPAPAFLGLLTIAPDLLALRPHRRRHTTTLFITTNRRLFSLFTCVLPSVSVCLVWARISFIA